MGGVNEDMESGKCGNKLESINYGVKKCKVEIIASRNVVVQIWNMDNWDYKLVECGRLGKRSTFKSGMQMPIHVHVP